MASHDYPSDQATAYTIRLSARRTPGHTHSEKIHQASADITSDLLMQNHAHYHTLYNEVGLHNHIVHHLLSIYALGASPSEIQEAYDLNKSYQVAAIQTSTSDVAKLSDPRSFKENLGDNEYYSAYLAFFQDEITKYGVEHTLNEYLFKGDERADDLLGRMFAGFEHPILHLGFGLEFKQPCLVAEALASAAIHDDLPLQFLLPVERLARTHAQSDDSSISSIVDALRRDPVVSTAVRGSDGPDKISSGLLKRGLNELIPHLARYSIRGGEGLPRKLAEMQHLCAYLSSASQRPGKAISFEFFMMHSTNLSVFFSTFLKQSWLSEKNKIRLLTWKVRMDLTMYAGNRCPDLHPDRVKGYSPKLAGGWSEIFGRACRYRDDGHTAKLVRSLRAAEESSKQFTGQPGLPLEAKDFLKIAHMVMDSVERMDESGFEIPEVAKRFYIEQLGQPEEVVKIVVRWVRWCGLPESWDHIPDLPDPQGNKSSKL